MTTAKIGWELYALTHEEQLQATKQEICIYVTQKVGCDPSLVATVYDAGMMFGSTANSVRQGWRAISRQGLKEGVREFASNAHEKPRGQKGSQESRVRLINNRMPINAEYANKVYPLEKLPPSLRQKYPHSVPFTGTGHPDFSRYAIKRWRSM